MDVDGACNHFDDASPHDESSILVHSPPDLVTAPRSRAALLAAIVVTLVTWASAFAAIRHAARAFPPASLALCRFAIASLVLAVAARVRGMPVPPAPPMTRGQWARLAAAGLVSLGVYQVALNAGSRTVSAGVACLLVNTGPIFTAIGAMLFLRERLRWTDAAGIECAFGGVALLSYGMGGALSWGGDAGLVMLAAVAQAVYFGVTKPLLAARSAFETTCWTIWLGTLFLLPWAPEAWRALAAAPAAARWSVVYLGVFPGAIGYLTWTFVLSRMPASRAASLLYLVPPIAFAIAWLALGERPALLSLLGGIPIVAGVAFVNARPPRAAAPVAVER